MSSFMIHFLVFWAGTMVGGFGGAFLMALMIASRRSDDDEERVHHDGQPRGGVK